MLKGTVRGSLVDQVLSERRLKRGESLVLSRAKGSTLYKGPEVSMVKKYWSQCHWGAMSKGEEGKGPRPLFEKSWLSWRVRGRARLPLDPTRTGFLPRVEKGLCQRKKKAELGDMTLISLEGTVAEGWMRLARPWME